MGVKPGTSDDIIYTEINKPDIIATTYHRQFKFYQTFLDINEQDCITRKAWIVFKQLDNNSSPKDFLNHYESLNLNIIEKNIQDRRNRIRNSEKTTLKRYFEPFNLEYNNVLYKSMLNDQDRAIITRWRLSSQPLYRTWSLQKNLLLTNLIVNV